MLRATTAAGWLEWSRSGCPTARRLAMKAATVVRSKPFDPHPAAARMTAPVVCEHGVEPPSACMFCISDALREAYWKGVEEACSLGPCSACDGVGSVRRETCLGVVLKYCSVCRGCGMVPTHPTRMKKGR